MHQIIGVKGFLIEVVNSKERDPYCCLVRSFEFYKKKNFGNNTKTQKHIKNKLEIQQYGTFSLLKPTRERHHSEGICQYLMIVALQ
jgi:hypothetical protein